MQLKAEKGNGKNVNEREAVFFRMVLFLFITTERLAGRTKG